MKLIREEAEEIQTLVEAKEDGSKNLYIEGIFLQSAIKNRNGRIYPEQVMDKEVGRYISEAVAKKTAFGELGHPQSPQIGLDRISHRIVSLTKEGTNYRGKAIITNTPMGNIARGIIESGGQLGVSSRALGTVKPNAQGINEVQSDFRLSTAADIVADPSAPDAWVNGIMEGTEWVYNPDNGAYAIAQIAEQSKEEIENIVKAKCLNEESLLASFERYLNRISNTIGSKSLN